MILKHNLFPLMIDLSDKQIVIIGAGKVATHKAMLFLDYTNVTVVNADFNEELLNRSQDEVVSVDQKPAAKPHHSLHLIHANIESLDDDAFIKIFSNTFLVISATKDEAFNCRIADLAKQSGALVNRVDAVDEVIIPSIISEGDLSISISTQGTSPALSKYTRKKIESLISPHFSDMSRLQAEIREQLKQSVESQSERKKVLWDAFSESYEKAYQIALRKCHKPSS